MVPFVQEKSLRKASLKKTIKVARNDFLKTRLVDNFRALLFGGLSDNKYL